MAGSSGPMVFFQADPGLSGLRGVVSTAEMVFNTKKLNKYRGKIAFIRALFLREIGVALGIGSTWKYLGIAYKDPKKRNTLKNLYANTDDVAGGLYWSSNFGMTHGVVELDKTTRQMPLPKPIPRCCGYAQDVMKASLESATVIGPQSVGFLNALGYTIDYQNANQPLFVSVPCDGCDAEPQLFKPNMLVKDRGGKTIANVKGVGKKSSLLAVSEGVEGSGLDSVSARPAGRPCTRDEDCSGVCVTSMVGFLEAKGYNLYDEGIRGFASKVCKPKHHDFDIVLDPVNSRPDYDYIYEEARQKWLSIIRGIARPIRYDVNPVNLVIETAWFVASSDIIAYSGPTEAHFVDSADGSYWIPKKGILQFNLDFLLNDRMSLKQFKAYVLQQMGKVLLIGLWDLLTTSAQCMEPDRFTDAYLDGGGKAAMAHYILSQQWSKEPKRPLRLYRTTDLIDDDDCTGWDEWTLENELMTPWVDRSDTPLSLITAGSLEDYGFTIDYKNCDVWPNRKGMIFYRLFPSGNFEFEGSANVSSDSSASDQKKYVIHRPELKLTQGSKVIATVPRDAKPSDLRAAKKDLQAFMNQAHPLPPA